MCHVSSEHKERDYCCSVHLVGILSQCCLVVSILDSDVIRRLCVTLWCSDWLVILWWLRVVDLVVVIVDIGADFRGRQKS